jgi:hypothetical protein
MFLPASHKVFVHRRLLPRLVVLAGLLLFQTHGMAHPIDEVRSNAILEFDTADRQHFQWTVLLGRAHLDAYAQILRNMGQPPERDRVELAKTVERAFAFDGCDIHALPPPSPGQPDARFSEREGGAWIALHFAVDCTNPMTELAVRRIGYSAAKTRTTLYLAVRVAGLEAVRALVPPTAEAMVVPLDGQPARALGAPVQRKSPAKDTASGTLPSETMSKQELADATAAPQWRMPPRAMLLAWLQEGAHHLATGPDHLLFLLTLVVAATRIGTLLAAVTAFSLGHLTSMTLALLLHWPAPPCVDVAIGLTIMTAAFRARRPQTRHLWALSALTATFGLVHGLGFGNGLQRLVAGYDQLFWPLVSFGLGLDAAQVAWVLLCTALWRGVLRVSRNRERTQRFAATVLMLAGLVFAVWATVGDVP